MLLHGLRLWAAVCLALYVAFALELPNPFWAATSAGLVCQPNVGASLRKGWFRLIGTLVGATVIVVLTACFPQSRAGFLGALALWGALCGFIASLLRNFASYAAALAGYTAVIIASDQLGQVGGVNGLAFTLSVSRASEISIGIVCAGIVIAGTSFGGARRQLALQLGRLAAQIAEGLVGALREDAPDRERARATRRDLLRQVGELDTVIDQASGEAPALRFRPRTLQAGVDGLFAALSSWRTIAMHRERHPEETPPAALAALLRNLPPSLTDSPRGGVAWAWAASALRPAVLGAAHRMVAWPAETPSLRLVADRAAIGLNGLCATMSALEFLADPGRPEPGPRIARLRVPDLLPPLINALRVFVVIAAVEFLWIATAWPSGPMALVFAAVVVLLFSPREDAAYASAAGFMVGTTLAAGLAAVIGFAVLPHQTTFIGLCVAMGLVLVPAGALSAQAWQSSTFVALTANFTPILNPANPMSYDVQDFYNRTLAIVAGIVIALLGLGLIPPLPPRLRANRLLALTLRDFRRLALGRLPRTAAEWEGRLYGRLSAMPEAAEPLQHAQLAAALGAGAELIRLRRLAVGFRLEALLRAAQEAISKGDGAAAVARLGDFEAAIAALPAGGPDPAVRLRTRATVRALAETLAQHAAYFGAEPTT